MRPHWWTWRSAAVSAAAICRKRVSVERPAEQAAQRNAARVLEQEHRAVLISRETEGARGPRRIELVGERIFALQPGVGRGGSLSGRRGQHQHRGGLAGLPTP